MRTKQTVVAPSVHDRVAVGTATASASRPLRMPCNQLSGLSERKGTGISPANNGFLHDAVPMFQICCIKCC